MQSALLEYLLANINLLRHRDFLLEIFTECDRLEYADPVFTEGSLYVGKLLLKGNTFVSIKAFTQTDVDRYTIDEIEETGIKLEKGKALTKGTDVVTLKPGIIENSGDKPIKTTVGRLILNQLLLAHPFGKTFPYLNAKFSAGSIVDAIFEAATKEEITADQIQTYSQNLYFIGHMTEICVPNYTERSLTTDPGIAKRRKELMAENKEALERGDATVMSAIEDELIKMDKAYMEGDPSMDFYGTNLKKTFDIQRKKMFVMGGMSEKFGETGQFNFIDEPLSDGISEKNFAAISNEIRNASYSRAMETVNGGVVAKVLVRALQNATILEDDCGTKRTMPLKLKAGSASLYRDRYILERGKLVLLTDQELKVRTGTTVRLRSPMTCETAGGYCKACIGKLFKTLDQEVLTLRAMAFSSWILLASLKKSHGTSHSTTDVSDLNRFTF